MRMLVATHQTNGDAPGDYDHCVVGELVYVQDPCDSDVRDPDGPCGCGRGFSGASSHRATTTARVVDGPLTAAEIREALRSSLEAGGWLDPRFLAPDDATAMVDEVVEQVCAIADHFPVGSVVRRRLDRFYVGTLVP